MRHRHPAQPKSPQYYLEHGEKNRKCHNSHAAENTTKSGVTGISILFELFHLYKFDPVKDVKIDRMHLTYAQEILKTAIVTG